MKHSIAISVLNTAVGVPQADDGIFILFNQGVAVGSTLALNTPYLITQLSDAEALGITAAYDTTNGTSCHQQISEFYTQAPVGTLLWICIVANPTAYATFVAGSTFLQIIKNTGAANPLYQAKMAGFCYPVPASLNTSSDFPTDVTATILALQTLYPSLLPLGLQFSSIVDGYNMKSTDTPETLGTRAGDAAFSVSCCITSTLGNGVSQVGLALGRFSQISVGHGFGRVQDGPVAVTTAFLTNSILVQSTGTLVVGHVYTVMGGPVTYDSVTYTPGTPQNPTKFTAVTGFTTFTTSGGGYVIDNAIFVSNFSQTDIDSLGTSQYLFLRTWFQQNGFFWNDGATCCAPNLQLSSQEYMRVANKLAADALAFIVEQEGNQFPLDAKTGAIDQTVLNALQQSFYDDYIGPLSQTGTGDITDGKIIFTAPNFNATKQMNFQLEILPTVVMGNAVGTVQFVSTLN